MTTAFDGLLEEIEQLTKALPTEDGGKDENIEAAAAEGEHKEPDGDEGASGEGEDGEGEGEGEPMGKSFTMKLDDGTEVEAIDGTALVKALMDRVETNEGVLAKALGSVLGVVKAQGELIKSLTEKVEKLGAQPKGRKTVLSIAEKPAGTTEALAKSQPEGIKPDEFMAKCLTAQASGRISGTDVARAEAYLNRGLQVPADIVSRVVQQ